MISYQGTFVKACTLNLFRTDLSPRGGQDFTGEFFFLYKKKKENTKKREMYTCLQEGRTEDYGNRTYLQEGRTRDTWTQRDFFFAKKKELKLKKKKKVVVPRKGG